jgi:hypothetical protein
MQLDLRPVSLPGKNGGVDFELSQMQRVGSAIPKSIDAFDLLDYRRGMGCAQTIDPARKSEVNTSANGFPLHSHLGLVISSAPTLHAPVGPPALERTVGRAERAGARETARAVHKSDKFPHGSLEDNRCHGCENSPKIHRPSKGFGARLKPLQAFRKPCEFKRRSIRLPDDTPITQKSNNCARSAPAQRLHSIPRAERSGLTKRLDDGNHGVAIQNTGDIVGDSGGEFASAGRLKIGKNDITSSTAYVGECVSVEEKKRG